ncbi:hypothetical protein NCS56_00645900 [Fusarium sp. Ph1]|nr:hypothetical protein NCS56_00645900 [Fusarium sp. Ph1]
MRSLSTVGALLLASLWGQQITVLSAVVEVVEKRATINAVPCLTSGTVTGTGAGMVAQAKALKSAPWIPDCETIKDTKQRLECLACNGVASGTWLAALAGCTEGSTFCAWGLPLCEAICVSAATYVYWGACQSCYCLHADCSDASVRAAGRVTSSPALSIGGGHFALNPPLRYIGTTSFSVNKNPGKPANLGATLNCPSRGCNAANQCRSGDDS